LCAWSVHSRDFERAIKLCEDASSAAGSDVSLKTVAMNNKYVALQFLNRMDELDSVRNEVLELTEKGLGSRPKDADLWGLKVRVLSESNRCPEALQTLETVLAFNPNFLPKDLKDQVTKCAKKKTT